ncbi:MAG: hypothetical protein KIT09_22320 [Bryobacteraceae bacterium]|nr:hypothetical protein [Bryobacteraceae bacterium]
MQAEVHAPETRAAAPAAGRKVERFLALDAYRGLIMLMLVSWGFGFGALRDHPVYGGIAAQFDHVPWEGAVFWDLVQPAFMFIVGVAMPFALAIRAQQGATFGANARHVAVRALKLILLSQVLISVSGGGLRFQLINVLAQIAFTYFITFWILQLRWRGQVAAAAGLLAFHSALFFAFPGPEGAFSKEGNIGQAIDAAIFGRPTGGYYVTINFITSAVTTLFGAWAGLLVMSPRTNAAKAKIIGLASVAAFLISFALAPFIPNVKRIWTATFTFYSAGWVLLILLAVFVVVEIMGYRRWTFPLLIIGMNSIFIYSVHMILREWLNRAVGVFTGGFRWIGDLAPVAQACAVLLAMWSVNYWLYKRKIFFKV